MNFVEQPAATAPRATASLVLGIVGIVPCPICAPIAWAIGHNAEGEIDASRANIGGRGEPAMSVDVPVLPAVGLSTATGGAFALGAAGVIGAGTGTGLTCLFSMATGMECPFCGLTHGVAALGAGDVGAAVAANPLAPLALALALAVPLALLRSRRLAVHRTAPWALAGLVVAVWLVRLA